MNLQMVLDLTQKTIFIAALSAAPILLTAIIVGVLINILQTVTQIKDMSLTFVPKAAIAAVVMVLAMPWALTMQIEFCIHVFQVLGSIRP